MASNYTFANKAHGPQYMNLYRLSVGGDFKHHKEP